SGEDRQRGRGGAGSPALRPPPKGGCQEWQWPEQCLRPPARSPIAIADGDLWPGRDRGAAREARHRGGQDSRVEEQGAASISAANQAGRCDDCRGLSWRDQHTSGAPGTLGVFGGAVSKDTVSRVWRKVNGDWEAWNAGPV